MKRHIQRTKTLTECGRRITPEMDLCHHDDERNVCHWCRATYDSWHPKGQIPLTKGRE